MSMYLYSDAPMPVEPARETPCACAEAYADPVADAAIARWIVDGDAPDPEERAAIRAAATRRHEIQRARALRARLGVPEIAYEGESWGARRDWVAASIEAGRGRAAVAAAQASRLAALLPPVPAPREPSPAGPLLGRVGSGAYVEAGVGLQRSSRIVAGTIEDVDVPPCASCGGAGVVPVPEHSGLHGGRIGARQLVFALGLPCEDGYGELAPAALLELFPDRGLESERAFVEEAIRRGATRVYWA